MTYNKLFIFYHINIDNRSTGGIINFLRGFIKKVNFVKHISFCSLDYGKDYDGFENIEKIYLKQMKNTPNSKKLIPNNLIYIFLLAKRFLFKNFDENSLLLFNRTDHVLPFIFKKGQKILIIHGSSQNDKIFFKRKFFKMTYMAISERLALWFMNAIVLVSKDALDYYKNKYPKYISKLHFIPTFYDKNKFYKKDVIKNSKTIRYIYTGRFVKIKGLYELLEYIKFLNSKNIDFSLTMIGEGDLGPIFKGLKNVHLIDSIKQEELCNYLNDSDIFLLFSHFEGTPLSLIESMAAGTPAITSDSSELKNFITNGYNGFKFHNVKENFEDIYNKSLVIKSNQEAYCRNCIDFVKKYEIERVMNDWINLINTI